jgi:hypothetical protein
MDMRGGILYLVKKQLNDKEVNLAGPKSRLQSAHAPNKTMVCYSYTCILVVE